MSAENERGVLTPRIDRTRFETSCQHAEHPHEWFKYFLPGEAPDEINLPVGASLLVTVNNRPATFSYCYDAITPMKSAAIRASPHYDNTLTNFIVNRFHYGASTAPDAPNTTFVVQPDYSIWYSESIEHPDRRIHSWKEAIDLGLSAEKLARLALYFLYPALGLNKGMFTRFLLERVDKSDVPDTEIRTAVVKAARREANIDPVDRVGGIVPFELLSLTGPPI